jgi:plastocyanin
VEGFYVYGVRKSLGASSEFLTKGIDEKGGVFTRTFQGLEAIVSKVSLEEFDSETIQIKAQNDLHWIKEKAVIHEAVIEEAMRNDGEILSLIPMKFGTIFKDEKGLRETLNKDHEQFKETLEKLEGKQEWGVKAYLTDQPIFEQAVKENNAAIQKKAEEIAALPEGMAFFMEEELTEAISREVDKELNHVVEGLYESLSRQAESSVQNHILGRELTGRREAMVFNAAFLVEGGKIEEFKEAARKIEQEIRNKGLDLEFNGPWPAYHFATLEK